MAEYNVILDEQEVIEFDSIKKSIDYCKRNNQHKKYAVICPTLQYTLVGTRVTQSRIDWVNSDMFPLST